MKHPLSAEEFYDALAAEYDGMVAFESRLQREREILAPLVRDWGIHRAVDMATGTGVHALALADLNVKTTGVDISEEMLARAAGHCKRLAIDVTLMQGDMSMTQLADAGDIDAVFCLGNSVPHLTSLEELAGTFSHWKSILRSGGHVVVQLLNYERILGRGERIVGIRQPGATTILRFYDFLEDRIHFNILVYEAEGKGFRHRLQTTELLPILPDELRQMAGKAGFTSIELYSSLKLEKFHADAKDVVLVCS